MRGGALNIYFYLFPVFSTMPIALNDHMLILFWKHIFLSAAYTKWKILSSVQSREDYPSYSYPGTINSRKHKMWICLMQIIEEKAGQCSAE